MNPIHSHKKNSALAVLLFLVMFSRPAWAQVPALDELAGNWQSASNLLSMPALNNSLGSAKAVRDVLSTTDLSFPPVTMTGESGALFIDGNVPVLNQTRWYPYQVLRKATAGNLEIETAVRMTYEQKGLLFHVIVTNSGIASQTFELKINLSANTSRHIRWGWGVPRDKDTNRFSATAMDDERSLLLHDYRSELANCLSFEHKPDAL